VLRGRRGETIFKKFINFYGHNFVVPNTDVRINKKNLIMVKNIITERATFFFDCITNKNHKYSYEMFRKGPVHNLVTIIFVQKKGCTFFIRVNQRDPKWLDVLAAVDVVVVAPVEEGRQICCCCCCTNSLVRIEQVA